jgi:hypothetical protein
VTDIPGKEALRQPPLQQITENERLKLTNVLLNPVPDAGYDLAQNLARGLP